ncbi:MAG TPA: hypothetical protein VKG79_04370 [Bryobacteraceae bacterium]|nr:hypothetical protein [Bryobacteraceae bacterium]
MKQNLEGLKAGIEQQLEQAGIAMFQGHSRTLDDVKTVYWDCQKHPDYEEFIQAAKAVGAKLMVFHQRTFAAEEVDDALEQLGECNLPREEYRDFEQRLKSARVYDGLVCEIEMSFDHDGCMYMFDLRTEWFQELSNTLEEIHILISTEDDRGEDSSLPGYFSKN